MQQNFLVTKPYSNTHCTNVLTTDKAICLYARANCNVQSLTQMTPTCPPKGRASNLKPITTLIGSIM